MPIDAPVAITVSLLHDTTVYVPVGPFIGALTATMPWPRLGIALFIEALTAKPLKRGNRLPDCAVESDTDRCQDLPASRGAAVIITYTTIFREH